MPSPTVGCELLHHERGVSTVIESSSKNQPFNGYLLNEGGITVAIIEGLLASSAGEGPSKTMIAWCLKKPSEKYDFVSWDG